VNEKRQKKGTRLPTAAAASSSCTVVLVRSPSTVCSQSSWRWPESDDVSDRQQTACKRTPRTGFMNGHTSHFVLSLATLFFFFFNSMSTSGRGPRNALTFSGPLCPSTSQTSHPSRLAYTEWRHGKACVVSLPGYHQGIDSRVPP